MKRIGFIFLAGFFLCGLARADESVQAAGKFAMPFTQEGGTARAMSMGSTGVSMPQGSASLFWNPAGLATQSWMEIGLHHISGLGDSNRETSVIGMPLGSLGGFAASLNYVNNGNFEGRDSIGNQTSNYSAGDMGGSLGWGKQWFPGISGGVAVKYNRQTLAAQSYSATALDVGFLWHPVSLLNLGLTYFNLGTKVADTALDSGWRGGASYSVRKNMLFAVSTELKPGGFDRLQVGAEGFVHSTVAVRVGFVQSLKSTELTGVTGLTAGLGIRIDKNLMLDYAYLPFGELGVSQRISVTYNFSNPEPKDNHRLKSPSGPRNHL